MSTLGCVMAAPKLEHWNLLLHILTYLSKYPNLAITYSPSPETPKNENHSWETWPKNTLYAYADASFADNPDSSSKSGWIILLNGAPVAWRSKNQSTIAKSSMEAEVYSASDCSTEIQFLRSLLFELEIPQKTPTIIHEDNEACITYGESVSVTDKNKHMVTPCNILNTNSPDDKQFLKFARRQQRVTYMHIKTNIQDKIVQFKKCHTDYMLADMLTKNLANTKFKRFRDAILQFSPFESNPTTNNMIAKIKTYNTNIISPSIYFVKHINSKHFTNVLNTDYHNVKLNLYTKHKSLKRTLTHTHPNKPSTRIRTS